MKPKSIMKAQQHRRKQKRLERATVVLICLTLITLVGFGAVYTVELSASTTPESAPKPAASRIEQLCQQKLLAHIQQGGVDLQAEMSYGDLQGCSFSSSSERGGRALQDIEMSIINRNTIL